ncbi:hypothetical protein COLO4_37476 [Corchorus olitorius]|uniref:Uncharacterized protein n=1 Tax=Corchorus olitorius TaxID=93759 RepID=A0A1R3G1E8_9ROSI|nr:hypothetical protein COLO4_37476 [Corchorus olitorius]
MTDERNRVKEWKKEAERLKKEAERMEVDRDHARASLSEEKEKNRVLEAKNIRAMARAEHQRKSQVRAKKRELRLEGDTSRMRREIDSLKKEVQKARNMIAELKVKNKEARKKEAEEFANLMRKTKKDHMQELMQRWADIQFLGKHLLLAGCKISNMVRSWEECDDNLTDVLAEIGEGVGMARELKKQVEEVIGAVFPTDPYG